MIAAVIQDQTLERYRAAKEAGYTHAVVSVDPWSPDAVQRLRDAATAGLLVVLRPRQWCRANSPELASGRPGWVEIDEAWLPRNCEGDIPGEPYEINSMASPWCDRAWELIRENLRAAQDYCDGEGIIPDGVWVGTSGELGFPRQHKQAREDWLWCWDAGGRDAHRAEFGMDPPRTLREDVFYHGGHTLEWMTRELVDRLMWLAVDFAVEPWLPVIPVDWSNASASSGTKILLDVWADRHSDLSNRWGVWCYCAFYGNPMAPEPGERICTAIHRMRLSDVKAIVGTEYAKGVTVWGPRAHRDGFAGVLTNVCDIGQCDQAAVARALSYWGDNA